jgi:hypothetical protein
MDLKGIEKISLLCWNIGDPLTDEKKGLLGEAIKKISPDIFCVSEGTPSIKSCEEMIDFFENNSYHCYYSPLHYVKNKLDKPYDYNDLALKIFVKDKNILKKNFDFTLEREEGRIVILKTFVKYRPTTFFLLHCKSIRGCDHSTKEQHVYIFRIRDIINLGKVTENKTNKEELGENERLIIAGDFNLQPYESVLNSSSFLQTSFLTKHNVMKLRKNKDDIFFNPSLEYVISNQVKNLGGTFYSEKHGWAILDYALYKTDDGKTNYDIISQFENGSKLLNEDEALKNNFLNFGIDHLPILITAE